MSTTAAGSPASYLIGLDDLPGAALLAASIRDVLLRIETVCGITGLSVGSIYRLMGQNKFPRPFKITGTAVAWRLSEVTAWVDSREREGGSPAAAAVETRPGSSAEN
jgi:prophage regulatory protein